MREVTIRAFEKWGGQDSINALEQYVASEQEDWLRDYANRVIRNLL